MGTKKVPGKSLAADICMIHFPWQVKCICLAAGKVYVEEVASPAVDVIPVHLI